MLAHSYRWLLAFLLIVSTSTLGAYRWVVVGDCYSEANCDDEFGFCAPVASSFVGVCFDPDSLTIAAGDSVTFWVSAMLINTGPHNVVADDGSFRCALGCDGEGGDGTPRDVVSRWSFTRAFYTPGTVQFHDEVSGAAGVINVVASSAQLTAVAVEYYYADWNFYFVTAFPDEIAALDGGAFGGAWKRTGQTFDVWAGPAAAALPTCRFLSTAFAPKSSHFYTANAQECALLRGGATWQYEGIAFYVRVPAQGPCGRGTVPLYRAYNNGVDGAPNHRYTTSLQTARQMTAAGWVLEGGVAAGDFDPLNVEFSEVAFACVPQEPVTAARDAQTVPGLRRASLR